MDSVISKVYYNPATGFQSAPRILQQIRRLHPDAEVTLKQVEEFISKQEVAQIHRQTRKTKVFRHIVAVGIDAEWQCDLIDLPKLAKVNNGYRYILTIVDIYSRYIWAIGLKNKKAEDVIAAFEKLFADRKPAILSSDNGKEFLNKKMTKFLHENHIFQRTNEPGDHNHMGIIERANKTVKTILFKYSAATGNKNWVNVIESICDGLNHSIHSTTKRRPVDVVSGLAVPVKQRDVSVKIIPEGTEVRIVINKGQFGKGYEARWSKALYTIAGRKGNRYYIQDKNGERQKKTYKESELQQIAGVQKTPGGVREVEALRDTFVQHATGKRVRKKKIIFEG